MISASTAAGIVSAGASVASTASAFSGLNYNVTFKLELENYTNEHLTVHSTHINYGLFNVLPRLLGQG